MIITENSADQEHAAISSEAAVHLRTGHSEQAISVVLPTGQHPHDQSTRRRAVLEDSVTELRAKVSATAGTILPHAVPTMGIQHPPATLVVEIAGTAADISADDDKEASLPNYRIIKTNALNRVNRINESLNKDKQ